MRTHHRLLGVFLLCAGVVSLVQAKMPAADTVKGAKDHPLVSRFEGAKMVAYEVKEFDETSLPAGRRSHRSEPQGYYFEKKLDLEGKLTRIAYLVPRERSSLEVLRNYQAALEKAGLNILYACAKEACGESLGDYWLSAKLDRNFLKSGDADGAFRYGSMEPRYLLASGKRPDGSPLHVAVYVVTPRENYEGGVYVEIVEGKPMETGKVAASLNAADMARNIANEGRVAVYGVYFDTGKAEVKPASQPALAEMAKLLRQEPKLRVLVVGHTDNQGELAHNLALSQRRAESVVKALSDGYKVNAQRLAARGVASYAPIASNRTDAGRQKNRRVELVEQ